MQELDTTSDNVQQDPPQTDNPASNERVGIRIPSIQFPLVTYVMLGSIAVIFLFEMIEQQLAPSRRFLTANDLPLLYAGIADFRQILRGDYDRLLTAMFFHLGLAHVALNAHALWIFGQTIERFFGHWRFLIIYILGGLAGSIATFMFAQSGAGASGAIFALFGAEMVFVYRNRHIFGDFASKHLQGLMITLLINLGFGLYTYFVPNAIRIGVVAHTGGFIIGAVLAWLMGPHYQVQQDPTEPSGHRIVDTVTPARIQVVSLLVAILITIVFYAALAIYRLSPP